MKACAHCGAPLARFDPACSFCFAPNPARDVPPHEVETLITRGQQVLQRGQPADAVELLAKAVALEPEAFDAYFYLAAAWHDLGKPERALDAMLRARAIRPGNAPLHYNIGQLRARLGQRYPARWSLWEAMRLVARDPDLLNKKDFVQNIHGALAELGPITSDEIQQISVTRDAQGHPINPELSQCLRETAHGRSSGLILRFYVALLRSFLLVPDSGTGPRDGVLRQFAAATKLEAVTVTGPDGKQWQPVFTDAAALRAFRPGAYVSYSAFPGVSVAQIVLSDPRIEGVVLNYNAGAGQPIERVGLEAIARGHVIRLEL